MCWFACMLVLFRHRINSDHVLCILKLKFFSVTTNCNFHGSIRNVRYCSLIGLSNIFIAALWNEFRRFCRSWNFPLHNASEQRALNKKAAQATLKSSFPSSAPLVLGRFFQSSNFWGLSQCARVWCAAENKQGSQGFFAITSNRTSSHGCRSTNCNYIRAFTQHWLVDRFEDSAKNILA